MTMMTEGLIGSHVSNVIFFLAIYPVVHLLQIPISDPSVHNESYVGKIQYGVFGSWSFNMTTRK